jgi:hypothetical protein
VRGEQITLNDGSTLTVPKSQAKLEERGGKKIVTSLRVTEGPQAGSTQ